MSKRKNPLSSYDESQNDSTELEEPTIDTADTQELEEIAALPNAPQTVTVKAVNLEVRHGRMLVYDVSSTASAWLVPVEHLQLTTKEQLVPQKVLDTCERAYSWDNELQAIAVSLDEVRLGLYYLGYYEKQDINVRQVVGGLLRVGKFPVVK